MSQQRTNFEAAAAKSDWGTAFLYLNQLSMEEMLDTLSSRPKATLDNLIQRRFAFKLGHNMPRMEYAWTVIRSKSLPLVAPGDLLKTGQVQTAGSFIKKPPASAPSMKLKVKVFRDSIVTNRSLFGELQKKAQDILASQGNGFTLDVDVHGTDLPLQEVVYLGSQLTDMIDLAKKQTTVPADRAIVLLVRVKGSVGVHGLATSIDGRRVVVIDTDSPNPDRATLLHELGHCAELPHAGETPKGKPGPVDVGGETNVMAETKSGVTRDSLTVTQGEFLANAFFASK